MSGNLINIDGQPMTPNEYMVAIFYKAAGIVKDVAEKAAGEQHE